MHRRRHRVQAWKNRGGEHLVWGPFAETCDMTEDEFLTWLADGLASGTGKPSDELRATLREGVDAGLFVVHRREADGAYGLSEDLEEKPQVNAPRWPEVSAPRSRGRSGGGAAPAASGGSGASGPALVGRAGKPASPIRGDEWRRAAARGAVVIPFPTSQLRKAA